MNLKYNLLLFLRYASCNEIKRSYRTNAIPSSDIKKLEKIFLFPESLASCHEEDDESASNFELQIKSHSNKAAETYIEFIASLALKMGLVSYDTEGDYAGYYSCEVTFKDNYIVVNASAYQKYLKSSSAEKEYAILNSLMEDHHNEFHTPSLTGSSERFSKHGARVNAAAAMKLPQIRKNLLEILHTFAVDTPILFSSFVHKVQEVAPDLIVPRSKKSPKYQYFYESDPSSFFSQNREIQESDEDSFMRVEGRYLAYFLENIPLLMEWVTLTYDPEFRTTNLTCLPPLPTFIQSFTISKKMDAMLSKDLAYLNYIKTTITPDLKIFIESHLSPDHELTALEPYTERVSSSKHVTILELSRKKTVQSLATQLDLPLPQELFEKMGIVLPKNVATEIDSWIAEADKFILYENVDLVEVDPSLKETILKQFSPHFVKSHHCSYLIAPSRVNIYAHLEKAALIPTMCQHAEDKIFIDKFKFATPPTLPKELQASLKKEKLKISTTEFVAFTVKNPKFLDQLSAAFQTHQISAILPAGQGLCLIAKTEQYKAIEIMKELTDKLHIELIF